MQNNKRDNMQLSRLRLKSVDEISKEYISDME